MFIEKYIIAVFLVFALSSCSAQHTLLKSRNADAITNVSSSSTVDAETTTSSGDETAKKSITSPNQPGQPEAAISYIRKRNNDSSPSPSHLEQCNRDLESLHRISPSEYARYRNEYDALMRSSAGFIAVSGDISDEVSDLARPRFQFALVNLCYRIKSALAKTLISQASGEGAL